VVVTGRDIYSSSESFVQEYKIPKPGDLWPVGMLSEELEEYQKRSK
jgi:hypothetical protein